MSFVNAATQINNTKDNARKLQQKNDNISPYHRKTDNNVQHNMHITHKDKIGSTDMIKEQSDASPKFRKSYDIHGHRRNTTDHGRRISEIIEDNPFQAEYEDYSEKRRFDILLKLFRLFFY